MLSLLRPGVFQFWPAGWHRSTTCFAEHIQDEDFEESEMPSSVVFATDLSKRGIAISAQVSMVEAVRASHLCTSIFTPFCMANSVSLGNGGTCHPVPVRRSQGHGS